MKQLLQNLRTGEGTVADVPVPIIQPGRVLVRTASSLISAGTERSIVELGQKGLLAKARERPELVKKVWERVKTEGLGETLESVRDKLNQSHAVGYSASGVVIETGKDLTDFKPGDRVACAGADYASHAEVISVPRNLAVRLPEKVSFEEGAFGTVGAIALQGVRLAEPTLGERFVVIGLGLIGQLTVQILKANGCHVFAIDTDESRIRLALSSGASAGSVPEDARQKTAAWTRGHGADGCIIAAATSSNEPIDLAGEISRLKGRVIAVGMVGMNVPRNVYFQRELTLKISRSYGPGRYDPEYEERGHDYPLPYVRWTEGRNIETFLELLSSGSVNVKALITHRFAIEDAPRAYELLSGKTTEKYLAVLLTYETSGEVIRRIDNSLSQPPTSPRTTAPSTAARVRIGLIGAGGYAQKVLLPGFKSEGVEFSSIASASGVSARDVGLKYGFERFLSDAESVIEDEATNLIVIATRHGSHAELAMRALSYNKHVFLEKPLALNDDELDKLIETASRSQGRLMVGFNRRFSPFAKKAKEIFSTRQTPLSLVYRINAGRVPAEHWINDPREGGGRIIGEVCHFIDLMQYLTGARAETVYAKTLGSTDSANDSVLITLQFNDGSQGVVAYLTQGDNALPKERIEIFGEGKTFVIDDFRISKLFAGGKEKTETLRQQDKGQREQAKVACAVVRGEAVPPIGLEELRTTTRATFRIMDSSRTGRTIEI